MKRILSFLLSVLFLAPVVVSAQNYDIIFGRAALTRNTGFHKTADYERVDRNDVRAVADNLIRFQNPDGGWARDVDWLDLAPVDSVLAHLKQKSYANSTLENRNVSCQVEYLAQAYVKFNDEKYRVSVVRALNFMLAKQLPCGGWSAGNKETIAFASSVMPSVLRTLYAVASGSAHFSWVPKKMQTRAQVAFDHGLEVVLKSQIVLADGTLSGWCPNHDCNTFKPVSGRSYELPCIASAETSSTLSMLMAIQSPSNKVKKSIQAAVAWLNDAIIVGKRLESFALPDSVAKVVGKKYDRTLVDDSEADRMWARFYDIDSNKPFFCNRDGSKVFDLKDVELERRANYGWYGYWPEASLAVYNVWKIKNGL